MKRLVFITKDSIAMWPCGAAIVHDDVWHRTAMKKTYGFFKVELIHESFVVWRIFPWGK